jgi:dihydropteroate synthase
MPDGLYLRPLGLLYGDAAQAAIEAGKAAPLAGSEIAFSQMQVITGVAGAAAREIRSCQELEQSNDQAIAGVMEQLTAPRAAIAGLSLEAPRLMGVVNVTPDSFSDGGLYNEADKAIARAAKLALEGADIVDIGGESTRPGASPLDPKEEIGRILPVIKGLAGGRARLSIDTRNAAVMMAAQEAGVQILNDVSALTYDKDSLDVAASSNLPIVLMHSRGDPKTMQKDPVYADVLLEVYDYLADRIAACEKAGISRAWLIADPGIGFGKTVAHNLTLISGLSLFHGLGVPLLLGASRKRFIGALTQEDDPRERGPGSLAAALAGAAQGAQFLRVHDVASTGQALRVWRSVVSGTP